MPAAFLSPTPFADPQLANLYVSAVLDRGNYTAGRAPVRRPWPGRIQAFNIGVRSAGAVSAFADLGISLLDRFLLPSRGMYYPLIRRRGPDANASRRRRECRRSRLRRHRAASGHFGSTMPAARPEFRSLQKRRLALPSIQAQLFPNQRWSIDLQDSGSFTLPTFVDAISRTPDVVNDGRVRPQRACSGGPNLHRPSALTSFVRASDAARGGASSGTITRSGLSATWQLAPAIRASRLDDARDRHGPGLRETMAYDGNMAPTVNAFWLTYRLNGGAISARCDLPARLARRGAVLPRGRRISRDRSRIACAGIPALKTGCGGRSRRRRALRRSVTAGDLSSPAVT